MCRRRKAGLRIRFAEWGNKNSNGRFVKSSEARPAIASGAGANFTQTIVNLNGTIDKRRVAAVGRAVKSQSYGAACWRRSLSVFTLNNLS
ncbi:hypothetical protein EVAR_31209_1 [Eumeta japonica]|uniref:Uncharacterized protein n=1 Tax=Eumeta variegata TaxID=151549 RepID=A0A4C1VZR9_EUMVA|nr:hypothetical protein EVAR_31209_1 [Eumeta japonica]